MKRIFLLFIFACLFNLISFGRDGVIKTSGDTIYGDRIETNYIKYNKLKYVTVITGSSEIRIEGTEVAFLLQKGKTILIDNEGWNLSSPQVILVGVNYYMALVIGERSYDYWVFDKNRRFIEKIKTNKLAMDQLRKYFGDCPEFKTEIDKAAPKFKSGKFSYTEFELLLKKYNCLQP